MIQQRPHDFLEIYLDGKYYYLVVLTKIVLFGGNIVFGFHSNGEKKELKHFVSQSKPAGFNCCVDLLEAKMNGDVKRIGRANDLDKYWLTQFAKSPIHIGDNFERRWGWRLYSIHDLQKVKTIRFFLRGKYKRAMYNSCTGFLFYTQLVNSKYLMGQNIYINEN